MARSAALIFFIRDHVRQLIAPSFVGPLSMVGAPAVTRVELPFHELDQILQVGPQAGQAGRHGNQQPMFRGILGDLNDIECAAESSSSSRLPTDAALNHATRCASMAAKIGSGAVGAGLLDFDML
jgi:hypothetical protein